MVQKLITTNHFLEVQQYGDDVIIDIINLMIIVAKLYDADISVRLYGHLARRTWYHHAQDAQRACPIGRGSHGTGPSMAICEHRYRRHLQCNTNEMNDLNRLKFQ